MSRRILASYTTDPSSIRRVPVQVEEEDEKFFLVFPGCPMHEYHEKEISKEEAEREINLMKGD